MGFVGVGGRLEGVPRESLSCDGLFLLKELVSGTTSLLMGLGTISGGTSLLVGVRDEGVVGCIGLTRATSTGLEEVGVEVRLLPTEYAPERGVVVRRAGRGREALE